MQKKIGFKALIIGGGRWGQITYNNLRKIKEISRVEIVSRTLDLNNSIITDKKIIKKYNLILKQASHFDLIIICKNNSSKLKYLKKIINLKSIIVVEKPLIIKNNLNIFIYNIKKKSFLISLPWFFENSLKKKIFNYISINKINVINFYWYDSPNKKYGLEKKFDDSIFFCEDIFSHIYSLLYNKEKKNIIKFVSFKNNNNIEYLEFFFENIKINLNCSYKVNKAFKSISFKKNHKTVSKININNKNFLVKNYLKNKDLIIKNNSDNLIKQYKYILNHQNKYDLKYLTNKLIIYQNNLSKLCKKSQL